MQQLGIKRPPPIGTFGLALIRISFIQGATPAGLRREVGGSATPPLLLTVARLIPHKGQDVVVRALAELRDESPTLHYAMVGTGPDEARLRKLAEDLKVSDRVIFAGPVSDDEVAEGVRDNRRSTLGSRGRTRASTPRASVSPFSRPPPRGCRSSPAIPAAFARLFAMARAVLSSRRMTSALSSRRCGRTSAIRGTAKERGGSAARWWRRTTTGIASRAIRAGSRTEVVALRRRQN